MDNVKKKVYSALNYFHTDDDFNRVTFGLKRNALSARLVRWRFADLILLGVLCVLYIVTYKIEPFQRQFFINDLTISHPFAESERVTNGALFFYSVWEPIMVIGVIGLIMTKPENKIYVTYVSILGVCISCFTTSVVTDVLKNLIGRHRPDFLARCVPRSDAPLNVMVFAKDVCTTDNLDLLKDGFRTTPSGHSSISFSGLVYLSLWLSGQLVIMNENLGYWRSILAWIPTLQCTYIALSRTEDYRHHFVDVIIGSLIGLGMAFWAYRRLFPHIAHPKAYEPYIIISEEEDNDNPDTQYNRINQDESLSV